MGQSEGSSRSTNHWPALRRHSCAFGLPQQEDALLISANRLANDLAQRTVFPCDGDVAETTEIRPAPPGGSTDPTKTADSPPPVLERAPHDSGPAALALGNHTRQTSPLVPFLAV